MVDFAQVRENGHRKEKAAYDRIKTIIGGFFMPRSYRNIRMYEEEILRIREANLTRREICEKIGLSKKQYENFINRYKRKQEKLAAGIALRKKGRPTKDIVITEKMTSIELRHIIARKNTKIKKLEMENELMRAFLSLTERK